LQDSPAIPIVIAAKHEFRVVVELVKHGSKYPQIAVSGDNLLGEFFQLA